MAIKIKNNYPEKFLKTQINVIKEFSKFLP